MPAPELSEALSLFQSGKYEEAIRICQGKECQPREWAGFRHLEGLCAARLGRHERALEALNEAVALRPGDPDYRYNLGAILAETGDHRGAVEQYRVGLELRPHDASAWNNLGNSCQALGRSEEALAAFERAIKYDRKNQTVIANLVAAANRVAVEFRACGREREAEPRLRRALDLQPDFAEAWNNLAAVLHDLGRLDEAERAVRRALDLRPHYVSALSNLGNILLDAGRPDEAMACYEKAVAEAPEPAMTHWNLALACLTLGDLRRGFREFEWRKKLPGAAAMYPVRGVPDWKGESVSGKRLLLVAEQGLGDTLQFIRYAPLLWRVGAEVWVESPPSLHRLLRGMEGIDGVVASSSDCPAADYRCTLMSLPHCLNTELATIPAEIPYLRADAELIAGWRSRFDAQPRWPRIGLVWAGDPRPDQPDAHRIDRRRSLGLREFSPLFETTCPCLWVSLQKGAGARQLLDHPLAERILDWTAELSDFADTAALVANLDLAISVDTSVAHLAGAMGVPVWVLSRRDGCWRWLLDRDDSPWYPTLRLFRQARAGDWTPVIEYLAEELEKWLARWHERS